MHRYPYYLFCQQQQKRQQKSAAKEETISKYGFPFGNPFLFAQPLRRDETRQKMRCNFVLSLLAVLQIYTAPFKGTKSNLHMVPIVWWVQLFERASAKGDFQEGLLLNGILFRSFSVADDRKRTYVQINCKLKLFINQTKNNFNLHR